MLTSLAFLIPHLPTLVLDEHRHHQTPMLDALARSSERFLADSPAAIVALSARWESPGPFLVDRGKHHATITDYTGFGVEVRYDCKGHPALARALVDAGQKAGIRVGAADRGVDSGITVPLHFLVPRGGIPVVPISLSLRPAAECRAWGVALRSALSRWPERVAFVVGGVLSNNLHAWNLKRDVPEAKEFDDRLLAAIGRGEWSALASGEADVREKAQPEAELRHLEVLRGFLASETRGEVRCYQSEPGVGAALVEFAVMESVHAAPPETSV